jgi:hypothetical protein
MTASRIIVFPFWAHLPPLTGGRPRFPLQVLKTALAVSAGFPLQLRLLQNISFAAATAEKCTFRKALA